MSTTENNTKESALLPAVCTQCGGQLTVDPSQEAAVCPFCGTPFIVKKAINQYNTVHVQNNVRIQHGKRGVFESAAELIDHQLEREHNANIRQQELLLEREKINLVKETRKKEQSAKFWKNVAYFFGWIYCFPIPLMLVLKKKDNIDPVKKKYYIIAAWVVYFLLVFGVGGSSKRSEKTGMYGNEQVLMVSHECDQTDFFLDQIQTEG